MYFAVLSYCKTKGAVMRRVSPASVFFLLEHVVGERKKKKKNSRVNMTTFLIINDSLIIADKFSVR